jgi:phosphatidylinositol-3-phosphatase
MVVMEENKGYAATLGTCSADPYYCSLASTYASYTAWHGVSHPSQPNYFAFTTGSTQGCASDTCGAFAAPSLGSQLNAAGISWTAYMESMPSACDTSNAGGYVVKHDPFVSSSAITRCAAHVLPYPGASSIASALNASNPSFVWITPNLTDDMHNGTVQQGDAWLKANLAPVLTSTWFTNFNATVIVTMDEGDSGTTNQIPTVVISSTAKGRGAVTTSGNHYGTLRAIEQTYGLALLGGAATALNGDLVGSFGPIA